MKDWFDNLDIREKRILIIGVVVLFFALTYLLVWEPFIKKTAALEKSNLENAALVVWCS